MSPTGPSDSFAHDASQGVITDAPAARVPAGELFADPGARIVWAAIKDLDEGVKHALLERLSGELAMPTNRSTPSEVRVARSVSALREAARVHADRGGTLLRQEDYRSLRAEIGEAAGWPPDGSVRRWLGGAWNDALRRAMLPAVPGEDVIIRELGPAFTREECVKAVKDYVADTGDPLPGLHAVINWARRPDVRGRAGHRPRSQGPYDRLFGSWGELLSAAGIVSDDRSTGQAVGGTRGPGLVRPPHGSGYTRENIVAALREVTELLGRSPRQTEYQHARQQIFETALAAGHPPRAMPSFSIIQQRYPSWDAALIDAGLEPTLGRPSHTQRKREPKQRYSDEGLCRWVRDSFGDVGVPFTSRAYISWRAERLTQARTEAQQIERIPDFGVISRRFGSWAAACERAGVDAS